MFSRAREPLLIIGDAAYLAQSDPTWRAVITRIQEQKRRLQGARLACIAVVVVLISRSSVDPTRPLHHVGNPQQLPRLSQVRVFLDRIAGQLGEKLEHLFFGIRLQPFPGVLTFRGSHMRRDEASLRPPGGSRGM